MNPKDAKKLNAVKFLDYAEKLKIENAQNMSRQELILAVIRKRFVQELPKLILLILLLIAIVKIF